MNDRKCQFCMREVDFCGFRVSTDGLSPDFQKIDAVTARIPDPSSVGDGKVFLEATGWYCRFIPPIRHSGETTDDAPGKRT